MLDQHAKLWIIHNFLFLFLKFDIFCKPCLKKNRDGAVFCSFELTSIYLNVSLYTFDFFMAF